MVWLQIHLWTLQCGCKRGKYSDGQDLEMERAEAFCEDHHPDIITPEIQEFNNLVRDRHDKIRENTRKSRRDKYKVIDQYMLELDIDLRPILYAHNHLNNGYKIRNPAEWIHRDRLLVHKYCGRYYCCKNRVDYLEEIFPSFQDQIRADRRAFITSMGWTLEHLAYKSGIPWKIFKSPPAYSP